MNNRKKIEHKVVTLKSVTINHPTKFFEVDIYLDKPATFFGRHVNEERIGGVLSRLHILNLGPLHVSLEIFTALPSVKHSDERDDENEKYDKTPSGDG